MPLRKQISGPLRAKKSLTTDRHCINSMRCHAYLSRASDPLDLFEVVALKGSDHVVDCVLGFLVQLAPLAFLLHESFVCLDHCPILPRRSLFVVDVPFDKSFEYCCLVFWRKNVLVKEVEDQRKVHCAHECSCDCSHDLVCQKKPNCLSNQNVRSSTRYTLNDCRPKKPLHAVLLKFPPNLGGHLYVRSSDCEFVGVFNRLAASLAEVGHHRMSGVSEDRDGASRPPRDLWRSVPKVSLLNVIFLSRTHYVGHLCTPVGVSLQQIRPYVGLQLQIRVLGNEGVPLDPAPPDI
mmetsp:Transcript_44363/g.87630  ORF Transcript_44363/g.87630 Transcript_44363/m.87630 type:complete len:292 (-) Transcript_44363:966-1841(-)